MDWIDVLEWARGRWMRCNVIIVKDMIEWLMFKPSSIGCIVAGQFPPVERVGKFFVRLMP